MLKFQPLSFHQSDPVAVYIFFLVYTLILSFFPSFHQ